MGFGFLRLHACAGVSRMDMPGAMRPLATAEPLEEPVGVVGGRALWNGPPTCAEVALRGAARLGQSRLIIGARIGTRERYGLGKRGRGYEPALPRPACKGAMRKGTVRPGRASLPQCMPIARGPPRPESLVMRHDKRQQAPKGSNQKRVSRVP